MPAINELLQQGRYRIIQQFGQDSTGAIYEAYDNTLGANVVLRENFVKLRKVTTAAQQESLQLAFANEARALTEIRHESFQHVRDYFSEIDRQYLVLEAIEGKDLGAMIEKNKRPFALAEVAQWADQILDALNYLHTHNPPIIHRDIKPRNVKLTSKNRVKIIPFGISKNPEDRRIANIANPATLHFLPLEQIWSGLDSTSQKVILNNYDEKSERILEQPADARSDVYGVGATLYYLLTARPPIDSLTRSIDILEGKDDPLPTPRQLNPTIPPEISGVLMKALEIRRENRFDSAAIMRQSLRTAFVRVKEREAGQTAPLSAPTPQSPLRQQPHQPETSFAPANVHSAEKSRLDEQKRQIAEQERLKIEAEQKRQAEELAERNRRKEEELARQKRQAEELAQQKEREAEAERLKAAQKAAAEAEILRAEKASEKAAAEEIPAGTIESIPAATKTATAAAGNTSAPETTYSNNEFNVLFAEPKTSGKSRTLSVAAVVIVVVAIIGVAGWVMMKSGAVESNQTLPAPSMSLTDTTKPEQTIATPPVAPNAETSIETPAAPTETVVETDSTQQQTPAAPPTAETKNKPLAAPRVKKQNVPATTPPSPAKTPAPEKKAVTVDDIINDN